MLFMMLPEYFSILLLFIWADNNKEPQHVDNDFLCVEIMWLAGPDCSHRDYSGGG